jgi:hypothetical protein
MDRELYKQEALRQLLNEKYYSRIQGPLANCMVFLINDILNELLDSGFISDKQFDYLRADIPADSRVFYLLPKIHKPRHKYTALHRSSWIYYFLERALRLVSIGLVPLTCPVMTCNVSLIIYVQTELAGAHYGTAVYCTITCS